MRPGGDGWLTRDDVLHPGVLEDLLARVGRFAETALRPVQGTWLLEGYAGRLAVNAIGAALTEGRIPDVSAGNAALRFDESGSAVEVAFERPAAEAAADRAELWATFRARFVGHLAPLVAALRPVTRRGERALWASVEDSLSGYLHWLGERHGLSDLARADADLLLGVEPPLRGRAVFVEIPRAGGIERIRRRNGCCLSFVREGAGGQACLTCPRVSTAERVRRLRAYEG